MEFSRPRYIGSFDLNLPTGYYQLIVRYYGRYNILITNICIYGQVKPITNKQQ